MGKTLKQRAEAWAQRWWGNGNACHMANYEGIIYAWHAGYRSAQDDFYKRTGHCWPKGGK